MIQISLSSKCLVETYLPYSQYIYFIAKKLFIIKFSLFIVKKITDSFYTLAIECIVHWDKWFGVDAKGKTTKYRKALEKCIESGIPIPTKFEFFKEKKKKDKS